VPAAIDMRQGYGPSIRSLGIDVGFGRPGRPTAHAVLVEGTQQAPTLVDSFELTSVHADVATLLFDLVAGLRSWLSGSTPDVVVISRADFFRMGKNTEGPRIRLMAEGALGGAARETVTDTLIKAGKDVAAMTGMSKADLEAHALATMPTAHVGAASAAIAGLS